MAFEKPSPYVHPEEAEVPQTLKDYGFRLLKEFPATPHASS
jgi:hypothetical protein